MYIGLVNIPVFFFAIYWLMEVLSNEDVSLAVVFDICSIDVP